MNDETLLQVEDHAQSIVEQYGVEPELARHAIRSATLNAVERGDAIILSKEEIEVVKSFRKFKSTLHKVGKVGVFKWMTRPGEVDTTETGVAC